MRDAALSSPRVHRRVRYASPPACPPDLGCWPLATLRDGEGSLRCHANVVLVSLERQLSLESGFGRLSTGPVAALFVPAGFRLHGLPARAQCADVFGLTLSWRQSRPPVRPREVLPIRITIDDACFSALATLGCGTPRVLDAARVPEASCVVSWLMDAQRRWRGRCQGHLSARAALTAWNPAIGLAEDALARCDPRHFELPDVLREASAQRRFRAVTGLSPRAYARLFESRRRGCASCEHRLRQHTGACEHVRAGTTGRGFVHI